MRPQSGSGRGTKALLLIVLTVWAASCGSSSSQPSTPSSTNAGTQPVTSGRGGSASITITGIMQGKLTHVICPDEVTANITGTINGKKYELDVTAPTSGRYALLYSDSNVVNGWYAPSLNPADTLNAAGGSINDDLTPNPNGNGSISGTVHASGDWTC